MAISTSSPNYRPQRTQRQTKGTLIVDPRRGRLLATLDLPDGHQIVHQEQVMDLTRSPEPVSMGPSSQRASGDEDLQQGSMSGSAGASPHASYHRDDQRLAPEMIIAALKGTAGLDLDGLDKILRERDTVSRSSDRSSSAGSTTSFHRQGTRHTARQADGRFDVNRHSKSPRFQSSEWETETLVDPASSNLDRDGPSSAQTGYRMGYPCPFRTRNPVRFNIRDHELCAKDPFGSISELRHHITTHHRRKRPFFQCPRCKLGFNDQTALEQHLVLPRAEMCEVNLALPGDYEDGITDGMHRALSGRYNGMGNWTWEGIWSLLFPEDQEVPLPEFQPVVELAEIEHVFDEGQDALKTALQEKLRLLLPGVVDTQYCTFLATQLDLVFETHRANMMRQCRSRFQTAEQQTLPRKPTRKSRRSTLLQSMQRSTSDASAGSAHRHTRTFSTFSIKPIEHAPTAHPPSLRRVGEHTTQTQKNAWSQPRRQAESSHNTTPSVTPANTNTDDINNPRDSYDSAIGIHCTDCNSDSCRCTRNSLGSSSNHSEHTRGRASPNPGTEPHPKEYYAQPRLSLRTSGLGVVYSPGDSGGSSGSVGGRFSPESFKQRVLRKQTQTQS